MYSDNQDPHRSRYPSLRLVDRALRTRLYPRIQNWCKLTVTSSTCDGIEAPFWRERALSCFTAGMVNRPSCLFSRSDQPHLLMRTAR